MAASLSGQLGISLVVILLGLLVYVIFAAGDRLAS